MQDSSRADRPEPTASPGDDDLTILANLERTPDPPPAPPRDRRLWRRLGYPRAPRRPFLELFPPSSAERHAPAPMVPQPTEKMVSEPLAPIAEVALPSVSEPSQPTAIEVAVSPPVAVAPLEAVPPAPPAEQEPSVYHSASYDQAAQALLSAIGRRDRIVLLTGDAGTGKTTLCRAVMDQVDARTFTALVTGPFDAVEDVLGAVLTEFGVTSGESLGHGSGAHSTRHELRVALRDFLRSLGRLNARATVFVDEAQSLSVEVLQRVSALANIESDQRVIQIVLVGRPELAETLQRPELHALGERVAVRAELGPLTRDEIAEYVAHKDGVTGRRDRLALDARALDALYGATHGVPGSVEQVCDRLSALDAKPETGAVPVKAIKAAAREFEAAQPEPAPPVRGRMSVLTAALLSLVLILGGAVAWTFRHQATEFLMRHWPR